MVYDMPIEGLYGRVLYGYRHVIYCWKALDLSFSVLDEKET